MKSEIVREEMGNLERDYAELAKLGSRYEVRPSMLHLFRNVVKPRVNIEQKH